MAEHPPFRLSRSADVGRLVAQGRRRSKLSQSEFAQRLGISRKTLSDLERGVAEHVSLRTALQALALGGFMLEASARRAPSLPEVMAQRAAHQARVDRLENPNDGSRLKEAPGRARRSRR